MPNLPEIKTATEDCYLGVHSRWVKHPTGIAGQLWKLQLDFDDWVVGTHVYAVFTKWDDTKHIDLARFPVRIVDYTPKEAMRSPTGDTASAYRRPPGKVELILQETPVRSVILSLYGGARALGALYCARPQDPPPPPPKPMPQGPSPAPPPSPPATSKHVSDAEAVISGSNMLWEPQDKDQKMKGLERVASLVVAVTLFLLAMIAGGAAALVKACKRLRVHLAGRKVAKRLRAAGSERRGLGRRVKLVFDDDDAVEVALYLDLTEVEDITDLQDLVVHTYESAGVQTHHSDVLALHYADPDDPGQLVPLTAKSSFDDVVAGGLLRLTRDSKSRRAARATRAYTKVTAQDLDSEYGMLKHGPQENMDDDDDDAFTDILEYREKGSIGRGPMRKGGSVVDLEPTERWAPLRTATRAGAALATAQESEEDEDDRDGDDADLIYRRQLKRNRKKDPSCAAAKTMSL